MSRALTPQPGDFAVVSIDGPVGPLIALGERLDGDGPYSAYEHAYIYVGNGKVVQAQPDGAALVDLTPRHLMAWSTGIISLTGTQRAGVLKAARGYIGTPYSFLDYFALAAHRFRLPLPYLKTYIRSTGHMICSQLVDQCYRDAGVDLFTDGRWSGYVTPADLARLLLTRKVN